MHILLGQTQTGFLQNHRYLRDRHAALVQLLLETTEFKSLFDKVEKDRRMRIIPTADELYYSLMGDFC